MDSVNIFENIFFPQKKREQQAAALLHLFPLHQLTSIYHHICQNMCTRCIFTSFLSVLGQ